MCANAFEREANAVDVGWERKLRFDVAYVAWFAVKASFLEDCSVSIVPQSARIFGRNMQGEDRFSLTNMKKYGILVVSYRTPVRVRSVAYVSFFETGGVDLGARL